MGVFSERGCGGEKTSTKWFNTNVINAFKRIMVIVIGCRSDSAPCIVAG